MGYSIKLTRLAGSDLEEIVRYIARDSPSAAVEFGQFLLNGIQPLVEFPALGRTVPEFDDPALREIILRSYRVVYLLNRGTQTIHIVRFWHGARGTPEITGSDAGLPD